MDELKIEPVAYVISDFKEKFGIPRQSGRAPSVVSRLVFLPPYREEALRGIENFSHLWLIFGFDKNRKSRSLTVRPPRLGGNVKTGVFATRSPFRPNGLGLSSVRLIGIEKSDTYGKILVISGADILDGTPVYDVKPYIKYADCHPDAECGFAEEKSRYKLKVVFPEDIKRGLNENVVRAVTECLSDDPRPAYHDDGREYGMKFAGFNFRFKVEGEVLTILKAEKTNDG